MAESRSAAATVTAPLGSATIFALTNSQRIASAISSSSTVSMRSTNFLTCAKFKSPGRTAIRPSAMLCVPSSVRTSPLSIEFFIDAAPDGSMPITAIPAGSRSTA